MNKLIVFLTLFFLTAIVCHAQEVTLGKIVSNKTYDEVLDRVFPREIVDRKETDWQIVLRFIPYTVAESQIVITKTIDGCNVTNTESVDGFVFNKISVWLTQNGREDVAEMSELIKVVKTNKVSTKAQANKWKNELFDSLVLTNRELKFISGEYDRNASWLVQLHGTQYQLWFTNKGSSFTYSFVDQEIQSKVTGRTRLVRWMNSVRLAVEKGAREVAMKRRD